MNLFSLLLLIISFGLLSIDLIHLLYKEKINNDLAYFTIVNMILGGGLAILYFYFDDLLVSFCFSLLLFINNIFLFREIKLIKDKYYFLALPFLVFTLYVFLNISYYLYFS